MLRVKLLNNGGYLALSKFEYPLIVEATVDGCGFSVDSKEFKMLSDDHLLDHYYFSLIEGECEVINE